MIEMLIVAAIVAKLGLDSAGKFAVDVGFGVRGKASPRLAEARARRPRGAASHYFSELWDDAWTNASKKHAERRTRSSSPSRPRGAARIYLSNLWRDGWDGAERRRQEKATRPRPGQQTVPGTVVPNAQDEDRPQPTPVPDEDDMPVPSTEDDETVPTPTDQQDEPDSVPDSVPDQDIDPSPATPTTEGSTMTTTMPTDTEVVSLNKAIDYSESTARVAKEMIYSIDTSQSNLAAGGVTGIALESFASAKESFGTIAAAMERAAAEFKDHLAIQEARIANPGAGSDEFIMGGR